MALILVGGGSRSGKSRYALGLAEARPGEWAFVATAQAYDEEMRQRIAHHQQERGLRYRTVEEPFALGAAIHLLARRHPVIVIDCLTLWLTNLLLKREADLQKEVSEFLHAAQSAGSMVIAVTNEVGCGIVPENALARKFRDLQGRVNQDAAAVAQEVYWMVFGCALRVK